MKSKDMSIKYTSPVVHVIEYNIANNICQSSPYYTNPNVDDYSNEGGDDFEI